MRYDKLQTESLQHVEYSELAIETQTYWKSPTRSEKKRNVQSADTAVQREHRLRINRERASTSRAAESVGQRENRLQKKRDRACTSRAAESLEQRENRLQQERDRASTSRAAESLEQRENRLQQERDRASTSRAAESLEQRENRLQQERDRASTSRAAESLEQRENRLQQERDRASTSRATESVGQRENRLQKRETGPVPQERRNPWNSVRTGFNKRETGPVPQELQNPWNSVRTGFNKRETGPVPQELQNPWNSVRTGFNKRETGPVPQERRNLWDSVRTGFGKIETGPVLRERQKPHKNHGNDMAIFGLSKENTNDEISQYLLGRYISSNEAVWRILSFPIHERHPNIVHLSVHLENGQRVYFTNANARTVAAAPPNTTLTAFFQLCQLDPRKQGTSVPEHEGIFASEALGRVYTVHPNNAECFFSQNAASYSPRTTSFSSLKCVNGEECRTFREACQNLGLLEGDQHWDNVLSEAASQSFPEQIRELFAILLTTCNPSNPHNLWEKYRESMSEDVLIKARRANPTLDINFSSDIFNEALLLLQNKCLAINDKTLSQLGLQS
ncbi:hypothetical protein LAZ67_16002787 [Cordylochernes scorpioides]|uniref:STPR domain-containing protein n=1 Tax=Cordylochernes scorpioides TaxID=51811 RepID=A0ABY6LC93_9ARAC|nr:hypothetical protein LAZ67_16002787 [Cordylochernes scorpioides]